MIQKQPFFDAVFHAGIKYDKGSYVPGDYSKDVSYAVNDMLKYLVNCKAYMKPIDYPKQEASYKYAMRHYGSDDVNEAGNAMMNLLLAARYLRKK
jgi:hypothetical protein